MKFLGVIPSRYASTRLEGKPLKDICGHTMIEWVYKRTKLSNLDEVVVATDDERIYKEVEKFGGKAILTRKDHENGTSRIAEVCEKYSDYDVIVNVQGDEPLIEPDMINSIIESFKNDSTISMSTLKYKLDKMEDIENPNYVKVITDKKGYALYFSRSVIPYPRKLDIQNYYKHVGIYGYKREFVIEYAKMEPTPLELSESLEQLRALENGYRIKVMETPYKILGVDTQEELEKVREYIKNNGLTLD
ncbi:3-deoxy-manno-octulosonate cytidylyltransferase [uncultured Fusobacterium sp.]|uniref:3-deoxy-manno-octulosonate cytidylyltransferase n=1 Tax=uncultured Fusobacterium sp. TaxID=159267 RepID=UPI0025F0F319|nr:3-deoxy-manno-octulosonate cytidylyltransferase [uncultured Fusobacterium sp.]